MLAELDWPDWREEPLAGDARVSHEPWDEAALADRGSFEAGLRDAGLPEPELREAVELRDEVSGHARAWELRIEEYRTRTGALRSWDTPPALQELVDSRTSVVDRLRDWFRGRSFRVDAREEVQLRIPLFLLAAAGADGCTASVTTLDERTGSAGWGITVFGTGLAGSAKVKASASSRFTAAEGESKVVFLPAVVTVEQGTMLEGGRETGRGHRIDGASLRTTGAPALVLLPPGRVPARGATAETYVLSGDATGALATYTYAYSATDAGELELGVKAFGAEVGVKASVELTSSMTVTFELAAGRDYELHRLSAGDGLLWAP